jgi:2-oxo-3-(phosphooxy)propyl 3-oxoalkanoate synthase
MEKISSDHTPPPGRRTPVAHALVHRTSPAEVLLTDVVELAEGRFAAAAYWPRSHPTFDRPGDGRHSPLLVAETIRELGLYIPLAFYGAEDRAHFLIEELCFEIDPRTEPRAGYGGSEITCDIELDERRPSGQKAPRAFRLRVDFSADSGPFATASGRARTLSEAAYAAVRRRAQHPTQDEFDHEHDETDHEHDELDRKHDGFDHEYAEIAPEHSTEPADPASVGVPQASDVLIAISPTDAVSLHPADPLHPFFFDHACDHVPGIVLIEAARQAAALTYGTPHLRPTACSISTTAFTEPAPAAQITCVAEGDQCTASFQQNAAETARVILNLTTPSAS